MQQAMEHDICIKKFIKKELYLIRKYLYKKHYKMNLSTYNNRMNFI